MSLTKIEKLTHEQEALIPVYQKKWRQIVLSTEPVERYKATEAVKAAYALVSFKEPKILFFDSPHSALNTILDQPLSDFLYSPLWTQWRKQLCKGIYKKISKALWQNLSSLLDSQLESIVRETSIWGFPLENPYPDVGGIHYFHERINEFCHSFILPEFWAASSSWFDFCFSVLNCEYDPEKWKVYQSLVKNTGWLFPYRETCIVCDRARILSFDNQEQLHAEGSPAIQFADGYTVYACRGAILTKR
jgi:hypothetical protein